LIDHCTATYQLVISDTSRVQPEEIDYIWRRLKYQKQVQVLSMQMLPNDTFSIRPDIIQNASTAGRRYVKPKFARLNTLTKFATPKISIQA
jgi:hypothetical protein